MFYICKGCDQSCKECRECCKPCCDVLDKPLGGYVLLASLLMLPAAICGGLGAIHPHVRDCSEAPLMALCAVNVMLGVIHILFAFYVQRRLIRGLNGFDDIQGLHGSSQRPQQAGEQVNAKELMQNAGNVVLYDIGFCIYVFVFMGSFFFNLVGLSWPSSCVPLDTSMPTISALLLVVFGIFAFGFAVLWYSALACDECCGGGLFGTKPAPAAAPPQNKGLMRMIFGKTQTQPAGQATSPQYAQTYAPSAPAGATVYGQQAPQQASAPGATGPPPQQSTQVKAQQVAGSALNFAGQGMSKAGAWIGGGQKAQGQGR